MRKLRIPNILDDRFDYFFWKRRKIRFFNEKKSRVLPFVTLRWYSKGIKGLGRPREAKSGTIFTILKDFDEISLENIGNLEMLKMGFRGFYFPPLWKEKSEL